MKKLFAIYIFTGLLYQTTTAQTLRLPDILDSIQQSHPSVKMYDASIRSMDEAAKGAKSWMAPQVSTGLWMTPYNMRSGQYMVSGEQMFPNKKYNDANEAYMQAMSSVQKENKAATLNELFANAKSNYYAWIIIGKKLKTIDENEKLLQLMITNAETRYKNGLGKISAYYKAKASLGELENMRVMLQNELAQKRIALNALMNRDKQIAFEIDTNYTVKDYAAMQFDSSLFYSNRSDIKAVDKNIQLAHLQQDIEKANLKPQFGIRYDHMFGFGGVPPQYSLMGMMKIPLSWSTKMNKANIESLKWKAAALQSQKEVMANEYSGMAYGMQQDITAKKRQLQLFENNIIPALRKNYQSTLLAYEQNTEELFALYDAWQTLNSTQLDYLDQQQQLLNMQVDLEKLLEIK